MHHSFSSFRPARAVALGLLLIVGLGAAGCQTAGDKAEEKSDRAAGKAEGRAGERSE